MTTPASVAAWTRKAESDLKVARDELATPEPATDAICFHCQQCAEKYLKAYLVYRRREVPRTHNIAELLLHCASLDGDFQPLLGSDVTLLTSYAVALRYPGDEPDPSVAEARYAVHLAEQIRAMVRAKLSAPDHQP